MKRILLTLSALAVGTAAASAADMPVPVYTKAPPPMVAPIYNWGGFYLGLNGGGGSAHKCWTAIAADGIAIPAEVEGCHNATGGTFGGQIGYRWQVTNWVFGVEAQGNWADFTGHNANLSALIADDRTKMDAFGLFTGQVGWAWNNVLFYAKGGAAVVNDSYSIVANASSPFVGTLLSTGSETRWGGTAGVGVEFGFSPGWSVGVEYDHLWLGTANTVHAVFPTPVSVAGTLTQQISQSVDIGLVRVNYTFGGPLIRY